MDKTQKQLTLTKKRSLEPQEGEGNFWGLFRYILSPSRNP